MNPSRADELVLWYLLPCVVMAGISIAYFRASSDHSVARRLVTSGHGAAGALLYTAALLVTALTDGPRRDLALVLGVLYVVPLTLLVTSMIFYRGRRDLHVFQVVNVPTIVFTAFIGLFLVGVRAI